MKIQVSITQEGINDGVRRDCQSCPVALALTRAIGEEVIVSGIWCTIAPDTLAVKMIELPRAVREWIVRFDRGFLVSPFTFELEVPA